MKTLIICMLCTLLLITLLMIIEDKHEQNKQKSHKEVREAVVIKSTNHYCKPMSWISEE